MRMDLPQCNFKNCRKSFDGNCTDRIEYDRCDFRLCADKQIELQPDIRGETEDCFFCHCPACGERIVTNLDGEWIAGSLDNYCHSCGQKLYWDGIIKKKLGGKTENGRIGGNNT